MYIDRIANPSAYIMYRKKLLFTLVFCNIKYPVSNHLLVTCVLFLALLSTVGCVNKNTTETKKPELATVQKIEQNTTNADNKHQDKSEYYYTESEIRDLGFRIVKLDDQYSLLCSNESNRDCVCLEPLPCVEAGNCIGLEENIDGFKAALNQKQEGRSVNCQRAEVGQCGNFQYFLFNGDISRRELRWFGANGTLVAQRNSTDYNAYCNGKARTRFMGKIPKCASTVRKELICGQAETNLANAIEDLRRLDPNKFR